MSVQIPTSIKTFCGPWISHEEWVKTKGADIKEHFPEVDFTKLTVKVPDELTFPKWTPFAQGGKGAFIGTITIKTSQPSGLPVDSGLLFPSISTDPASPAVFEFVGIMADQLKGHDKVVGSVAMIKDFGQHGVKAIPVKDVHIFFDKLSPKDLKVFKQLKPGQALSFKASPVVVFHKKKGAHVSFSLWHDLKVVD